MKIKKATLFGKKIENTLHYIDGQYHLQGGETTPLKGMHQSSMSHREQYPLLQKLTLKNK